VGLFDVVRTGLTGSQTVTGLGAAVLTGGLLLSLAASVVVLAVPPPRGADGQRGSWRILLRVGLAFWSLSLAAVVLSLAVMAPALADVFSAFGATLPVPTRGVLALSMLLTRFAWITAPLALLLEVAVPAASHLVIRRLPPELDWIVVVAGGLFLAIYSSVVGFALYLPLFTLSQAVGP
jgi:hypothetical protein